MKSQAARDVRFVRGLPRAVALAVTVAVMLLFSVTTTGSASAAPKTGSVTTVIPETQLPEDVTGVVSVTDFTNQGGTLIASGTATLTNTVTGVSESQAFAVPVVSAVGTCEILDLVLGPLDLDLLGLVIHLDQVVLNITAEQGPGNLLGNLLCAIAGLLDGSGPLGALAGLLDRILAILG